MNASPQCRACGAPVFLGQEHLCPVGTVDEDETLAAIRNQIELLAPDERIKVHALAAALRAIVASIEPHGALALGLVAAELAVTP